MLDMSDVVSSSDMGAPQPFTILRSVGQFVSGGFVSATTPMQAVGPVQRASAKEVQMLPEADQVGGVMAFWWTSQIFTTRGKTPLPSVQGTIPTGITPGSVYNLVPAPPDGVLGLLTKNGLLLLPGADADYQLTDAVITLATPTILDDRLYYEWPIISKTGQAASDLLVYASEQYRVLAVKHYPGSGYWKALGTRTSTI